MKKRMLLILSVMTMSITGGCGTSQVSRTEPVPVVDDTQAQRELVEFKENSVSKEEYDKVVQERDELKESTVSKEDYDSVVAERDALKARVDELETEVEKAASQPAEDTNTTVTDNAEIAEEEPEIHEPGVFGTIKYVVAPFYVENKRGQSWNIERFEITELKESFGDYNMSFTCAGNGDFGNITFYCYDEEGYQVDSFLVAVRTNSGADKFKIQDSTYIPMDTAWIDVQ